MISWCNMRKKGRLDYPNWLIVGFRASIADSGLQDLCMASYPFTWEKSRGTPGWTKE